MSLGRQPSYRTLRVLPVHPVRVKSRVTLGTQGNIFLGRKPFFRRFGRFEISTTFVFVFTTVTSYLSWERVEMGHQESRHKNNALFTMLYKQWPNTVYNIKYPMMGSGLKPESVAIWTQKSPRKVIKCSGWRDLLWYIPFWSLRVPDFPTDVVKWHFAQRPVFVTSRLMVPLFTSGTSRPLSRNVHPSRLGFT